MIRREFLSRSAGTVGALALTPAGAFAAPTDSLESIRRHVAAELARRNGATTPATLADDEPFWAEVRSAFVLDPSVVNLDHGWTNPAPRASMDELVAGARRLETLPAEQIVRFWEEVTNPLVKPALAQEMGVYHGEIALVRNATEALNTVLLGVPLSTGDEVVCSAHDYYAMLDALRQREAREGIVLRVVQPPVPATSMDDLVELYESAMGQRTRLVLLTHPSNLTGQLLPVARIAEAAHRAGAEVVVDGAQSLGLLEEPVPALGCDYYGASCHKWLGAPIGMGVLWMRPEHTAKVWPAVPSPAVEGMSRYEWIGTNPEYVGPSLLPALELHRSIGPARKAARLRYLNAIWRERVATALPGARFYTLADEAMSCGLCTVEIPGAEAPALQQGLRERGILVQAMERGTDVRGLRVSPNVYTSPAELDRFVQTLVALAAS
jgi:selenocysteine lyase/cysteine desulfurase